MRSTTRPPVADPLTADAFTETAALVAEVRELRRQLAEANSIIDAVRGGEVDALLVSGSHGDGVYVLEGADHIYRTIVEEMQEGYLTLTADGTVLFCNKNFSDMVCRPQESIIGSSIYSLLTRRQDTRLIASCLSDPPPGAKAEISLRSGAGGCVPVLVAAGSIRVDQDIFSCFVITDLSAQKRSEKMTGLIFDQATEAVIICDNAGVVIRNNKAAAALLGDDLAGADFDAKARLFEERTGTRFTLGAVIGHQRVRRREVSFQDKNGKHHSLLLSAARLSGEEQGDFFGYVLTLTDITAIKKYATEITRLDRLNLIGEMAAGIGHEVRNPLTTVRGYLQMFRDKAYLPKTPETLDIMIDELDRANHIISEFLSLAKNKTVKLKPIQLNQAIRTLFPLIQADAFRMGSEIHLDTAAEIPAVNADERELRQCILNLIRNGLEAMPCGGVITISTSATDTGVTLAVRDQGPGISPDVKEKLGTPFFSTKENGTGLGLPVCYSIASRHGARMECDTGPEGTTFSLVFPMVKP